MAKKAAPKRPSGKTNAKAAEAYVANHRKQREEMLDWQANFQQQMFRTSFNLILTKPMIEFLCAVADGVQWDRSLYYQGIHVPNNLLATSQALENRGLIQRKPMKLIQDEGDIVDKRVKAEGDPLIYRETSYYRLTPAGEALVHLFKVTGVFIVADASVNKKSRR